MKAIALVSGGLDSTLAAKLIQKQGIEILALHFQNPFAQNCSNQIIDNLGLTLNTLDTGQDFLKVVKNPKHGYGANFNPCIDCRILSFIKAKKYMQDKGASFIITGEVLGQRPMSQNKNTLRMIDKESNTEGLILRPLSARLLPETIAEREGWVLRNKLLDFNGRSRKQQMELAKKFNIKEYPTPAGGCLLTDRQFTKRIKDLIKHGELSLDNANLLKTGRHFRISKNAKLIVGRDERENNRLTDPSKQVDYLFRPARVNGPAALGKGVFNQQLIKLSCSITARYCDLDGKAKTEIIYKDMREGNEKGLTASPLEEKRLISLRI